MVRYWHRLPTQVVDASPLETFKVRMAGLWSILYSGRCLCPWQVGPFQPTPLSDSGRSPESFTDIKTFWMLGSYLKGCALIKILAQKCRQSIFLHPSIWCWQWHRNNKIIRINNTIRGFAFFSIRAFSLGMILILQTIRRVDRETDNWVKT